MKINKLPKAESPRYSRLLGSTSLFSRLFFSRGLRAPRYSNRLKNKKSPRKTAKPQKFTPNLGLALIFSKLKPPHGDSSFVAALSRRTSGRQRRRFAAGELKKKSVILSLVIIIVLTGLLYYFKGQFIVALVNNQPIWRFTLIKEVEKQAGKTTLESLITKALILQEAKKKGVRVTEEEVSEELKKLEENLKKQGQDLDKLLAAQGMDREEIKEQIKIQKIVEKIVGQDIEVTDEKVAEYFEKNKTLIPEGLALEQVKEDIRAQLKRQKLNEKIEGWLTSLREKADIKHFTNNY